MNTKFIAHPLFLIALNTILISATIYLDSKIIAFIAGVAFVLTIVNTIGKKLMDRHIEVMDKTQRDYLLALKKESELEITNNS